MRTVASSVTPPRLTARVTRSRGHDMSDGEGSRERRRKNRSERQASKSGAEIPRTRKRRHANPLESGKDANLSTIAENPTITFPPLYDEQDVRAQERTDVERNILNQKPPGDIFQLSGSTTRTSRTVHDFEELDADSVIDALPDLLCASDNLLNFLVPSDVSEPTIKTVMEQLQLKSSRAQMKFHRLHGAFQAHRNAFGGRELIDIPRVLSVLYRPEHVPEKDITLWRPNVLLQKANIAILIASVFSPASTSETLYFWEELDRSFPNNLIDEGEDIEPATLRQNLQLALDIRTQYAIIQIARRDQMPYLDMDMIVAQTFEDVSGFLRGWQFNGMQADELPEDFKSAIFQRRLAIRETFYKSMERSQDEAAALASLSTVFSWSQFSCDVVRWANARLDIIGTIILARGGVEGLCESLSRETRQGKALPLSPFGGNGIRAESPEVQLHFEIPPELLRTASKETADARKMKKRGRAPRLGLFSGDSPKSKIVAIKLMRKAADRKAAQAEQHAKAQQANPYNPDVRTSSAAVAYAHPSTAQHKATSFEISLSAPAKIANERQSQIEDDDWQPLDEEEPEDDREEDAFQPQDAHDIIKRSEICDVRAQAESNKENEAHHPALQLRGASTLHMIDRQPDAERVECRDSQEPSSTGHQSEMSDLSQDVGFQESRQPPSVASRRTMRSSVERPASTAPMVDGRLEKRVRFQGNSTATRSRPAPASTVLQDRSSQPAQAHIYSQLNATAKEVVAAQPKKSQSRKPWSVQEVDAFFKLIRKCGVSYAQIKNVDGSNGILQARDQVALKDKARNMKMDFLKHFEKVPLSSLQIERLGDLGIVYNRETGHRIDGIFEDDYSDD
ncbi:MAG: hypothetical protein Q9163_004568 [Psora crenata]